MRLGEYLISKGIATEEQIRIALEEQRITKEKLGEILVRLGFVSRDDVIKALSEIRPEALLEDVLERKDLVNFMIENQCLILGVFEKHRTVYFTAFSSEVEEKVKNIFQGYEVRFVDFDVVQLQEKLESLRQRIEKKSVVSDDVSKFFTNVIEEAISVDATDIHFECDERVGRIRYRIDGILHVFHTLPLSFYVKLTAHVKNRSNMDVAETRIPQDGSFTLKIAGKNLDFRVATLPTGFGEKVSIRILDREKAMIDIEKLGLTKLDEWLSLTRMTSGLVLVCGPTGSGKTTTLYSTVKYLDKIHRAVYTIEDPVEYTLPLTWQVQVNRKVGLDFAAFLRTILRHDPDIVIVGEIRDKETAEAALRLADTGHLVYATLHTTDIPSTLLRLQGLGVNFQELRFLLKAILVQRLIRKMCIQCKGKGCEFCFGTGYKGRTLLSEFVKIENYQDVDEILERKKEYWTFIDDAKFKLSQRITTKEEIERVLGVCLV